MGSMFEEELNRILACLLGGAVGDALGAPVEFASLAEIRARYGPAGITDFQTAYGRVGAITDDTQMTLFTAEGLLRAFSRYETKGICHVPSVIHHAYLRWLFTQGERPRAEVARGAQWPDGKLIRDQRLFSLRAPGNTCLSALRAVNKLGEKAKNDSKGCGTVMRVAPIGLVVKTELTYELGAKSSALTHGHPTAITAGGAFALLIALLREGWSLPRAIEGARDHLIKRPRAKESVAALDAALSLSENGEEPSPEMVESLGSGWVAEEALAIAVYCALVARSWEHGVLLAVNHSGDSDSTASMTGQLLGLLLGLDAIPQRWRQQVELGDRIELIGRDMALVRGGGFQERYNWTGYPGW